MIIIYGKPHCSYCGKARNLLDSKKIAYEYIDITGVEGGVEMLKERGCKTVPQIVKDGKWIGGYKELAKELEI